MHIISSRNSNHRVSNPWITAFCAICLLFLTSYLYFIPDSLEQLDRLNFPGESAGRMLDRHFEFYEGYTAIPAWERTLHTFLFGTRQQVQHNSIEIFREVLDYFQQHPDEATPWALLNTRTRLLVALAETGQFEALQIELARMDRTLDEEVVRDAIAFAYTNANPDIDIDALMYGARLLPLGWTSDRLWLRIANKLDYAKRSELLQQRLREHGERSRKRVLLLSVTVISVLLGGLFVLLGRRQLQLPDNWNANNLTKPWSLSEGFAVIVRAGLMGLLISFMLIIFAGSYFKPGVLAAWSSLFASLPMLWFIHRNLLKPRGINFFTAFGLSLKGVKFTDFTRITIFILALEWAGTLLIAWMSWKFGWQPHWSEGLFERVIFGPWQTAFLSGVNLVIWAPIFEEIGFRGLLYTTIRSRFTPWVAIIVSALIFSSLHLYSLPGFLAVFWSGLVLAYAYERYRSLLPCIIVHALGNLLTISTVLLFYR